MAEEKKNTYSASEQALGYIYQGQYALLKLFSSDEDTSILIEKDDDIEIIESNGIRNLGSLKHRAEGNKITNLSTDFWKSVRIWLNRYVAENTIKSNLRFFLFTTSTVSSDSFQICFTEGYDPDENEEKSISERALEVISKSKAKVITPLRSSLEALTEEELEDFFSRIQILDARIRIDEIPKRIKDVYMKAVQREFRDPVFERLEGWWMEIVINLLVGTRTEPVFGYELSDKLFQISDQFKLDNLPIDYIGKKPDEEVDPENDPRIFVKQLHALGITSNRIKNAILDFYQAFSQRSSWQRENVLLENEIELYENRLVNEWERYRDVIFESLGNEESESTLQSLGRELYNWAELKTDHLRIRDRVTEPYIVRGSYHILANERPNPKVYWHPYFLERMKHLLVTSETKS